MRRGESVPVDLQTMEEVIKTVEELFQANELYLPPEKKAKLITLIYEDVSQGEIKAENFKSKVIELVRFAS